jgi:hypothetical protein
MDMRKLADRAKAELDPLSAGLDMRAALLAAARLSRDCSPIPRAVIRLMAPMAVPAAAPAPCSRH